MLGAGTELPDSRLAQGGMEDSVQGGREEDACDIVYVMGKDEKMWWQI